MNPLPLCAAWLLAAAVLVAVPDAAAAAPGAASAALAAPRAVHSAAELAALEQALRAQPQEAAAALHAAATLAAPGSPLQLELLLAEALFRTSLHEEATVQQLAQRTEVLAKPLAKAVALTMHAEWQLRHGSLGRAERLLS